MTRRDVREAWIEHVLFGTHVGDACRRVLLCYAAAEDGRGRWMSKNGRIRPIPHATVGAVLGMSAKTVANHIHEATSKGLLSKDPTTGYRGRPSAYQATFPPAQRNAGSGPVSLRDFVLRGVKVPEYGETGPPGIGEPFLPSEGQKVPGFGETQRARVPDEHDNGTPPAGSRGAPERNPGDWSSRPRSARPALRLAPPIRRASA